MHTVADTLTQALNCHRAGRWADAEAGYRQVLASEPDQPNALYLCGSLLLSRGRPAPGIDMLARAASLRPADTESRLALANARHRAGDAAAAVALWRQILVLAPGHEAAGINLAGQLRAEQDWAGAIDVAQAGLAHRPLSPGLWLALAAALLAGQRDAAALTAADAALELDTTLAEAWLIRGTVLSRRRDFGPATEALHCCLRLDPHSARAELHLGNALLDQDLLDQAEPHLQRAVALAPDLAEAHTSLGFLHAGRHQMEAAIACHDRALALRPDFAEAHSNRAAALLLAGDYDRGFIAYEWRKRHKLFASSYWQSSQPEWAGESLSGRTILVFCEQGLGDTLMCARYLPLLAAQGARIVLVCAPSLSELLISLPGVVAVVPRGDPQGPARLAEGAVAPPYDVWIDQLSLPRVFRTRPDSIPGASGYLQADPGLAEAWRPLLPPGRKAGIVWAGNAAHGNDRRRSMPFGAFAPLIAAGGASFISLQCGPAGAAAAATGLHDPTPALTDYAQTAALVANLDLVIAVDTSVAHLAGALGIPCWLLLPHAPEWRWMLGRADSPWYASMRLFRQNRPGDWTDVMARLTAAFSTWRESSTG